MTDQSPAVRPSKAELRQLMREKRAALTPAEQASAARGLLDRLLEHGVLEQARAIAMYLVNDGEIDPVQVMRWCWENSRTAYVPLVIGKGRNALQFAPVEQDTRLVENRFGIPEPDVDSSQVVDARLLDLVLVPLVAFDRSGNRIGMGGGFYDTTFEFIGHEKPEQPRLVGIAHELQCVDRLETESWDIPLDTVITDLVYVDV